VAGNESIGRHWFFPQVPGLDYEMDNLYNKVQLATLRSSDMDIEEVSTAVKKNAFAPILSGAEAFSGLRIGPESTASTIAHIRFYTFDISSTAVVAGNTTSIVPSALIGVGDGDKSLMVGSPTRVDGGLIYTPQITSGGQGQLVMFNSTASLITTAADTHFHALIITKA